MTALPDALSVIFTEFYYWVTVVFMFLIHVGFCMYEVATSREKNHMHTLMKNTMVIPVVTVTFFLFGWWIYFAMPNGWPFGDIVPSPWAVPWSELMGAHLGGASGDPALDAALGAEATTAMYGATTPAYWARLNGVFWAAFLLFSWTTASIVSGAIIERVKSGAFWIIGAMLGSVTWILDASWGWHAGGWMVRLLGYHDAYASGVVHAIAGGTALAVLIVLGPRLGKFRPDGTPRNISPRNPWLVTIGLFLIFTGFWGFYAACNIPIFDIDQATDRIFYSATNIYLQPTSLSAITFNFIMALSGGLMATYIISRGDAFWTYSGGLCGVIGASAGNDLYHPIQALVIGAVVPVICYRLHYWVERRFKIDDAVGAVAVHGYGGFLGVVIAGFVLWGLPSSPFDGYAPITPWGNFIGALIMFVGLGFIPGFIAAKILNAFGLLRIPREIELVGLDLSEYAARYEAEDDVQKAEVEEARARGLLKQPAE